MKKQGLLNFQRDDSNVSSSEPGLAPAIVNGKYDHIRMRECIAHWILMHEHSFSIVEEARFDFMMKAGIPQWRVVQQQRVIASKFMRIKKQS